MKRKYKNIKLDMFLWGDVIMASGGSVPTDDPVLEDNDWSDVLDKLVLK